MCVEDACENQEETKLIPRFGDRKFGVALTSDLRKRKGPSKSSMLEIRFLKSVLTAKKFQVWFVPKFQPTLILISTFLITLRRDKDLIKTVRHITDDNYTSD